MSAAASSAGGEYRFTRAPIVTYAGSGADTRYSVYVRLPTVLPDGNRVRYLAQVSFSVSEPGSSRFYGSQSLSFHAGRGSGTCIGNDGVGSGSPLPRALRHPAAGRAVEAIMRITFGDEPALYVRRLVRVQGPSSRLSESRAAARLGCRGN